MNTSTYQGSAKIYQFPTTSRLAATGHRAGFGAVTDPVQHRMTDIVEQCWYHDTAVKQAAGLTKP